VPTPGLAFYPSTRVVARLPETVQSRSGRLSGGTFSVTVASGDPPQTVHAARV